MNVSAAVVKLVFQSTPPRRGRPVGRVGRERWGRFNPRPREGGDLLRCPSKGAVSLFQSTPPRRGRPSRTPPLPAHTSRFQSTPPRRGRPCRDERGAVDAHVSIHAPAKGATSTLPASRSAPSVSIHAPAKGATVHVRRGACAYDGFQSTPPRRGRPPRPRGGGKRVAFQSTPPRRGRPCTTPATTPISTSFNPRPREGGDPGSASASLVTVPFQSTPPRRGRPFSAGRGGQDFYVSIHAPAKGATSRPS